LGGADLQIDDFNFLSVLLLVASVAILAASVSVLVGTDTQDSLGPPLNILVGLAGVAAAVGLFRGHLWAKLLAGAVAFWLAASFPIGTAFAAVTFLTLGRDWQRHESQRESEKRAAQQGAAADRQGPPSDPPR
jgi:phosphate/sulfate permease